MTWEEIMRRVLPPVSGVSPQITSAFGDTNRPKGSTNPHRAVDFNYNVGPDGQRGINLAHPTLHSPVAGVVTSTGGRYGIIAIRDANGFSHEILHSHSRRVKAGDLVGVGTPIGTMGRSGADAEHVHYQLKDRGGNVVNPTEFWNSLDTEKNDPSQPAYLDRSRHAAEVLSGLDEKSPQNGDAPFVPKGRFDAPFSEATGDPFGAAPPANFTDRFGNWASMPGDVLRNVGAPNATPANPGQRSEVTPTNGDAPADIPVRRLVNLSFPAVSAPPLAPASPPPLLGIFSGKPMGDYAVRAPIFQSRVQSPPEDDELFQRWMRWFDT